MKSRHKLYESESGYSGIAKENKKVGGDENDMMIILGDGEYDDAFQATTQ